MSYLEGYSWGEFYETTKSCIGYSEEEQKKFTVFENLDKATTFEEIREIIKPLTEIERNWLNSPCLDGIICAIKDPKNFMQKEYVETWKFFLAKNLIKPSVSDICANNYANVIFLILDRIKGNELNHVLLWASEYGHTDTIKLLLDRGADIHIGDDYIIRLASENGHTETVRFLLDRGANKNGRNGIPLSWASYNGHAETVTLLLDRGADIHANNDEALRWASKQGRIDIVRLLLDRGANIHANNDEALCEASKNGHADIVKLLNEIIMYEKKFINNNNRLFTFL